MSEDNNKNLEKLASKVANDPDNYVPVIGNLLYTYDDGSVLYPNFKTFFKKDTRDQYEDKSDSIVIHESVIDFLVKGNFKLILTTSPFDVLDEALKNKGVPIKSYYHRWRQEDCTNVITREKGEWKQNVCKEKGIIGEKDTLVYHLLGEKGTATLPETERDFLDCLVSYQTLKDNSLPNLLSKKQILLLGSGIPNWLFLLLWYPLMRKSDAQYLFNRTCEDNNEFLTCWNSLNFFKTKEAMDTFLEIVTIKMNSEAHANIIQRDFKYDVFLSYKKEDETFAKKIYKHLNEKCGLNVWYMDAREDTSSPGEFYERLSEGLKRSRTFMPIIGLNYIGRFANYHIERSQNPYINPLHEDLGLITETYMAQQVKKEIMASTGSKVYEMPVWDVDSIDTQFQSLMERTLKELGLFQKVIKYSYSEKGKEVNGYMDFRSQDWKKYLELKKD